MVYSDEGEGGGCAHRTFMKQGVHRKEFNGA